MKIKTDEKFIARKARLGKYSSLAGLVVLSLGMFISFSKPEWFNLSLLCLVVGFGIASIGSYNVSRWVRPPRGDEVLEKALKGLSNKYQLFNYTLPSPHVLLTPFGLYVLLTKKQDGQVTYKGQDKWYQQKDFKRRLRLFFGGEQPVGNPSAELASEIASLRKYLSRRLPNQEIPIDGAIVFLSPDLNLTVESDDLPILKPKDLKKFLTDQQKQKQNWQASQLNEIAEALESPGK
jgi:hypothetical protein